MSMRAYFAPASIGNVAAGFDLLGAALAPLDGTLLGDVLRASPAAADTFLVEGPFADALAGDARPNLALRALALFRARTGGPGPLRLVLEKRLPVKSGLGSSASSIVAALAAFQDLAGSPLAPGELLDLAGQAEGATSGAPHLDNVAPSLLGGLRLVVPGRDGGAAARDLPWPRDLLFAVVHPDLALSTAESRAVLPAAVPLAATVGFAGNLAGFVHALHAGDRALLARCLRDPLAEPHRAPLVPGFEAARAAAFAAGALGFSLSGSGPSVFAVVPDARARAVADAVQGAFTAAGIESQAWVCALDTRGARALAGEGRP
ncbi:homoserine kinase [Mesoterricola sediminis]|uniref:Homoserine kinase n=1 Tax=Mesoterricola sediminis TaxID=2927980 RepID=A0AA48KG63_9BACT|nr:homoserine kinase [Mesoterricola sediminis]BDU77123.1 homoserine kinase [Mesoterricola sediminis]